MTSKSRAVGNLAYSHTPKCPSNTLEEFQKLQKEFTECIKG